MNRQFQPSAVVEMQIICNHCPQNRYKKQRGYNPNSNCVVIKFLPIPLAVMIATIILKVKPIEAAFALKECGTEVMSTNSVLYTVDGHPIDPTKMSAILGATFQEFGLPINLEDIRHALEAFAHKFSPEGSSSNPIFAQLAHHAPGTSFRYGRDQGCFVGIPADISIANSSACNNWNSFILDSPSMMSEASRSKIMQQLQSLDLIGHLNDLAEGDKNLDTSSGNSSDSPSMMSGASRSKIMQQLQSLDLIGHLNDLAEGDKKLDTSLANSSDESIRVHVSDTSAANSCSHDAGGAFAVGRSSQLLSSDMSESEQLAVQSLQSSSDSDTSQTLQSSSSSDKSHAVEHSRVHPRVHAASDSGQVSTVVSCTSPPTLMKRRVRNEQEIQERKLLAQKKLKLFEGMRPKQKQAVQFLEQSSSSACILLPTGSGKTLLIWTHKKEQECAVIFVPYRILGSQLQGVFESHGLTVTWPLHSYSGSIEAMLCNVQFAILPYEAAPEAVGFITALKDMGRLGPIWVDEVCCAKSEFVIRS